MIPEAARSREDVLRVGTAASYPAEPVFDLERLKSSTFHIPVAVIPAALNSGAGQAGIHFDLALSTSLSSANWIPAFAGMTTFI
ncbi:MAG TPA: hypothetical protein VFE67_00875 [Rudaea sp.]|jgi:hypothetical protein|nr:hypothetical protein [Rudaea sp.]